MNKWQKLRNEIKPEFKVDNNVITLSGDVVDNDWSEEGDISPATVQKALSNIDGDVTIKLNSGGGDVFAGIEIYNSIKDHEGLVTVEVTGLAASAASIIAMGADEVVMCTGAMMMIHEASTIVWGTKSDMLHTVDMLDKIDSSIVDIYQERNPIGEETIKSLLLAETWMTAEEAVENGFADRLKVVKDDPTKELEEVVNSLKKENELIKAELEAIKSANVETVVDDAKEESAEKLNSVQKLFFKENVNVKN